MDLARDVLASLKRSPICRCHSDGSIYGSLYVCPRCGHRSFDWSPLTPSWGGCERRRCGYEVLAT